MSEWGEELEIVLDLCKQLGPDYPQLTDLKVCEFTADPPFQLYVLVKSELPISDAQCICEQLTDDLNSRMNLESFVMVMLHWEWVYPPQETRAVEIYHNFDYGPYLETFYAGMKLFANYNYSIVLGVEKEYCTGRLVRILTENDGLFYKFLNSCGADMNPKYVTELQKSHEAGKLTDLAERYIRRLDDKMNELICRVGRAHPHMQSFHKSETSASQANLKENVSSPPAPRANTTETPQQRIPPEQPQRPTSEAPQKQLPELPPRIHQKQQTARPPKKKLSSVQQSTVKHTKRVARKAENPTLESVFCKPTEPTRIIALADENVTLTSENETLTSENAELRRIIAELEMTRKER